MNALKICQRIRDQINKKEKIKGRVHSVFNRACNIITDDDELISILSNGKSMAPMSVLIKEQNNFIALGIVQDMKVTLNRSNIFFSSIKLNINLIKAKTWNPKPQFLLNKTSKEDILQKLKIIEDYILAYGKLEGIAPLVFKAGYYIEELGSFTNRGIYQNGLEVFIIDRFIKLLDLTRKNNITYISDAAKKVIGFGPGLTPSIDDFIAGLMVSLLYLADYFSLDIEKVYRLNAEMVKEIDNKTTKISERMLKLASLGEVSDNTRKLIISLLSECPMEEFTRNLQNLLTFGETSGTDTLCGILTGSRIMFNEETRRLFKNGN